MPRLTKDEHEAYMKTIMGLYDNPDDAAEMVGRLRDDYAASLEVVDSAGVEQSVYNALYTNYQTLREQYIDRFFGGESEIEEVKTKQTEDIKEDSEELTYENLFKKAESYTGKDDE